MLHTSANDAAEQAGAACEVGERGENGLDAGLPATRRPITVRPSIRPSIVLAREKDGEVRIDAPGRERDAHRSPVDAKRIGHLLTHLSTLSIAIVAQVPSEHSLDDDASLQTAARDGQRQRGAYGVGGRGRLRWRRR